MSRVRMAAHVHSEWSHDAAWTLPAIARAFSHQGYGAVLMSEHDRGFDAGRWADYQEACADASSRRVLLVPGIEYEDADNVVHTPVWGESTPFLGSGRTTGDLLAAAREHDAVAVFAHPWRRDAWARFDPAWASLLSGVEIWNRKYDGFRAHPGAADLAGTHGLTPFASLDFHTWRQTFPLAMVADLPTAPTVRAVVEAVRAGTCEPMLLGVSVLRLLRGRPAAALQALDLVRQATRGPARRAAARRASVGATTEDDHSVSR